MSTFTKIKEKAGSLFGAFKASVNKAIGGNSQTANVFGSQEYINKAVREGAQPSSGPGSANYGTSSGYGATAKAPVYTPRVSGQTVPQVYSGSTGTGSNQNVNPTNYAYTPTRSGGSTSSGGSNGQPEQPIFRFDRKSGSTYAKSAGLGNANLEGQTQEQADETINLIKDAQRGQSTALTSAVFSSSAPSAVEKRVKDLTLSLNSTQNDPWKYAGSKQEDVDNMLKSTAKDLADQFDSTEAMVNAYDTDTTVKNSLDTFSQYGGSDDMLTKAMDEKNRGRTPRGMSTPEYIASVQQATTEQRDTKAMVDGDKVITDEIAREAKIPEQLKDKYFSEDGTQQQLINMAKENISLLKEKIADEKASAREKARLYMQKNDADLSVAKNTIEQNRINAKNYLTGMLAKLGALNTTSAAVEGITILDQKYQQQSIDAESKVKLANQDIQIRLNDTINDIENGGNEKIRSIKEDLSKDQTTILKEIAKAQLDSEKRIYELTLKASDRAQKNIEKYRSNMSTLSKDYTTQFSTLISNGIDVGKAAASVNVKLPTADRAVSNSARIKDPSAISYFKTLPTEFKNQWIQFASTQPQGTYFTLADIQANYEPYVLEQRQKPSKAIANQESESTLSDEDFLNALNQ